MLLMNNTKNLLNRIKEITLADLEKNHSVDLLFQNTVEELGEYAAARIVEQGIKTKELREHSWAEAIDLTICALSLYFASGGSLETLCEVGNRKLDKWEARVK